MGTIGRLLMEPNAELHVLWQPHIWAGAQKKVGTHTHDHSSHTSSSQKVETTQMDRLFKHIGLSREENSIQASKGGTSQHPVPHGRTPRASR